MKRDYRYRLLGIGLFVGSSLVFTRDFLRLLRELFAPKNVSSYLSEIISAEGQYGAALFYLFISLGILRSLWGIILSIILIKSNTHNKQVLWWIYSLIGIKVLAVILYLPLKFYFVDLIITILVYVFFIHHDNYLSRMIKNKGG